jgi:hypothetical protein
LTIGGTGFVTGMAVSLGAQALTDVVLLSPTQLSARLPAGTCPGSYPVVVRDSAGRQVAGGTVTVQGVRTATAASTQIVMPSVRLTGRDQVITVPLPELVVQDTMCVSTAWRLSFSVGDFSQADPKRQTLAPRSLQVSHDDGSASLQAPLTSSAGRAAAEIVIPRSNRPGPMPFRSSVELVVPASAFAGQYTAAVRVQLVEET